MIAYVTMAPDIELPVRLFQHRVSNNLDVAGSPAHPDSPTLPTG